MTCTSSESQADIASLSQAARYRFHKPSPNLARQSNCRHNSKSLSHAPKTRRRPGCPRPLGGVGCLPFSRASRRLCVPDPTCSRRHCPWSSKSVTECLICTYDCYAAHYSFAIHSPAAPPPDCTALEDSSLGDRHGPLINLSWMIEA